MELVNASDRLEVLCKQISLLCQGLSFGPEFFQVVLKERQNKLDFWGDLGIPGSRVGPVNDNGQEGGSDHEIHDRKAGPIREAHIGMKGLDDDTRASPHGKILKDLPRGGHVSTGVHK